MSSTFGRSAHVYDALCRHKDYASASATLCAIIERLAPYASTLLDVGCGTGLHLSYLRRRFEVEGLDLSREMLEVAKARCPGVTLHQGALADFDLAKRFDVVTCLFGSIAYAGDEPTLHRSADRLAAHVHPGGLVIVEPWVAPERFVSGRLVLDTADDPDLKVARMYVTERRGNLSVFDSTYLVGTANGVTSFQECQELGLFEDTAYRHAFDGAGLDVVEDSGDLFGYGLYVCRSRDGSTSLGNG